jgi:hypothetical protein
MAETRAPTAAIEEMLDRYGPWVDEGRPVFLTREEFEVEQARFGEAAAHLDRSDREPAYAAEQRVLLQVKSGVLGEYPYVHLRAGPFLVFYAASDLRRDPEASEADEATRLAGRREVHLRRLAEWTGLYAELVDDMRGLYPEASASRHSSDALFPQWIFADPVAYREFVTRVRRDEDEAPYRVGFLHAPSGWAYLAEPVEADQVVAFRETAAYLGALQVLRHWARDPADPTTNHWDRSEAYWFKEGLPAFLASRRVGTPIEGRILKGPWQMPPLIDIVQRRAREERRMYLVPHEDVGFEGAFPPDTGYTDLAWLLVRHLNADERRPGFERFLRSQVEGKGRGIPWFEECFGVKGSAAWSDLERAAYADLE